MNAITLIDIPDDLAAEAAEVPGLRERLVCFLRAEVSLHRRRQSRHSAQAREIVQQAKAEVAAVGPLTEEAKAKARQEFVLFYEELMKKLP